MQRARCECGQGVMLWRRRQCYEADDDVVKPMTLLWNRWYVLPHPPPVLRPNLTMLSSDDNVVKLMTTLRQWKFWMVQQYYNYTCGFPPVGLKQYLQRGVNFHLTCWTRLAKRIDSPQLGCARSRTCPRWRFGIPVQIQVTWYSRELVQHVRCLIKRFFCNHGVKASK